MKKFNPFSYFDCNANLSIGYNILNPILLGIFDQRVLHEGRAKFFSYLAPKPKLMETPNEACRLVFTKIFQKN